MFVKAEGSLHPNLIKISMLLTVERVLGRNSTTLKKIQSLKLTEGMNVFEEFSKLMSSDNLSQSVIVNLITECCSYLLSLENPSNVIAEYVYSYEVMSDIKRKVDRFNNNKNTYDINAILGNFKEFVIRYSIGSYDLESDNLKAFLCNAYNRFYSKDEKYKKEILDVLNAKGSVVNGEEGSMSLSDKMKLEIDVKETYKIDFPNVVKDISIASDILFNISNEVVFDLFSFYKEETSKLNYDKIKSLFIDNLGSVELIPTIFEKKTNYSTQYTENTVNKRYLMLKRINNLVDNGLYSGNVESLYNEILSIDMDTLNSANISTLFKYPKHNSSTVKLESIDLHNRDLFLKILKGVVSLKEFVKYLTLNKIDFSDARLFRNQNNYRRYNSLESYMSLNELSEELVEESKESDVQLPYYENDRLYDVLSDRFNLSSLCSIYNEHVSKMFTETSESSEYLGRLNDLVSISYNCKTSLEEIIDNLKSVEVNPACEEAFDYVVQEFPDIITYFEFYFIENSPSYYLKDVLLETKNIYNLLRFFDFSLMVFDHLSTLMNISTLSNQRLFFSNKLDYLELPRGITSVEDLAKIKSDRFKLNFYKEESPEYVDNYYSVSKFYSALFEIVNGYVSDVIDYIDSWVYKFRDSLKSHGISIVKSLEFSNIKLRSKLASIESLEDNLTRNFVDFVSKYPEVNGLLFDNGVPIVYEGYLVHVKGYLLATFSDFAITKVDESQVFNIKNVKPWRGVLWKV